MLASNLTLVDLHTVMVPKYNISLAEERELSLQRLKRICDAGFISVMDFWNNPLRIFAAHELAATIDPAMTVKMTVQFNCMSQSCIGVFLQHFFFKRASSLDNPRYLNLYLTCSEKNCFRIA
jgi:acyl-CoA oxidase